MSGGPRSIGATGQKECPEEGTVDLQLQLLHWLHLWPMADETIVLVRKGPPHHQDLLGSRLGHAACIRLWIRRGT